jgi:hypothetical protein
MSTGNTARGVIDPISFSLTAQYAAIAFAQFRGKAKTLEQLLEELQATKSYTVGPKDAIRYARSQGYLNYNDIVENLDRLTSVRITMACAAGAFELEDILPSRRKILQSPTEVLQQFVAEELPHSHRLYGASKDDFVVSTDDINAFREWILEGNPNFVISQKQYWVPKKSVTDSLMGMRVDLPYDPSRIRVVPGSEQDRGRKRENTFSQGRVISPKRRRLL